MQAPGIDPAALRHLVLPHDHIGGLAANPSMEVNRPRRLLRRDALADPAPEHQRPDGDHGRDRGDRPARLPGRHRVRPPPHQPDHGPVWGVIGGLHTVTGEDVGSLAGVAYLSASHCTVKIAELAERYPASFRPGGAGKVHRV